MSWSSGAYAVTDIIATPFNSNGFLTAAYPMAAAGSSSMTPVAATIYMHKIPVEKTITINKIWCLVNTAGTSYTNAQLGLWSSAGAFLGESAVQASAGVNGFGVLGAVGLATTAAVPVTGGPGVYIYAGFHAGVNNATAIKLYAAAMPGAGHNANVTAATGVYGSQAGHATNALSVVGAVTPSLLTITLTTEGWFAVS